MVTEAGPIDQALDLIDGGLISVQSRELVSSDEVADLLLDVRGLLVPLATPTLDDPEVAVIGN